MIKKIALAVLVLIAALLIFAATRPDTFRVQSTTTIQAPPEKIYPLINDLHSWDSWSPWEKLDPAVKKTYSGAPTGKGSVSEWEGNSKVGQGRMEITQASSPSNITINVNFIKPMPGQATSEFTLEPKGDSTIVTWTMYGPYNYLGKLMNVAFNMNNRLAKDCATGLANLKTVAEK